MRGSGKGKVGSSLQVLDSLMVMTPRLSVYAASCLICYMYQYSFETTDPKSTASICMHRDFHGEPYV